MTTRADLFDEFLLAQEVRTNVSSKSIWKDGYAQERAVTSTNVPKTHNTYEIFAFLKQYLAKEIAFLQTRGQCGFCGEHYARWENIGTHLCSYHPNPGHCGTHRCCDQPQGSRGCQPCDHTPVVACTPNRWTHDNTTIHIPLYLKSLLRVPNESIIETVPNATYPARSYITVRRIGVRPNASWSACRVNITHATPSYRPVFS